MLHNETASIVTNNKDKDISVTLTSSSSGAMVVSSTLKASYLFPAVFYFIRRLCGHPLISVCVHNPIDLVLLFSCLLCMCVYAYLTIHDIIP